ncbi:MAG TPA: hypothetical protein VNQ73_18870 [Ilumatobacter sp.]|nr:hypothetical protein [Ilumatobacter sp.]
MKRLLLVLGALVLAGCRLDLAVSVAMEPDGTGVVTVQATADQDLLDRVPGVLDDLRLDDAVAAGWTVGEPEPGDDGGATLTLTHPFHTAEELANVLNSIGPPFTGSWQAARTPGAGENEGQMSNAVTGTLQLADGFAAFSDADLTAAVGGQPFGEQIAASGLTPDQAMSLTFQVDLPGELVQSSGTEVSPGVFEWKPALDGSATPVDAVTVQRPAAEGKAWAGPLSTVALIALVAWVILSVAFIAFVVVARRSKRRKRNHALRNLR